MLRFIDLTTVDNLVVYKKSSKQRMIGLRWSYSQNESLDGFIISFYENTPTAHSKNITVIQPTKCLAWPEFYCHVFYNLSLNNKYVFKVSIIFVCIINNCNS